MHAKTTVKSEIFLKIPKSIFIWIFVKIILYDNIIQGIVVDSASKPALVQDTNYMVEKNHIAPYLGAFVAYLMPQWNGSKGVYIYKNYCWNVVVNSRYLPSVQKNTSFGQKGLQQTILLRKLTI